MGVHTAFLLGIKASNRNPRLFRILNFAQTAGLWQKEKRQKGITGELVSDRALLHALMAEQRPAAGLTGSAFTLLRVGNLPAFASDLFHSRAALLEAPSSIPVDKRKQTL
jgi:hypothetical protein